MNASSSLLDDDDGNALIQPRYGNSELNQFFIILKRTLLFSRRDWVKNCVFY